MTLLSCFFELGRLMVTKSVDTARHVTAAPPVEVVMATANSVHTGDLSAAVWQLSYGPDRTSVLAGVLVKYSLPCVYGNKMTKHLIMHSNISTADVVIGVSPLMRCAHCKENYPPIFHKLHICCFWTICGEKLRVKTWVDSRPFLILPPL